jgi:hypothetical protein
VQKATENSLEADLMPSKGTGNIYLAIFHNCYRPVNAVFYLFSSCLNVSSFNAFPPSITLLYVRCAWSIGIICLVHRSSDQEDCNEGGKVKKPFSRNFI